MLKQTTGWVLIALGLIGLGLTAVLFLPVIIPSLLFFASIVTIGIGVTLTK